MEKPPVLICGLGNPGQKYRDTRHNFGFDVVDRIAIVHGVSFTTEKKFNAEIARFDASGVRITLCKPLSYMNLSGVVVRKVADFYRIAPSEVMVITDDANLELGRIRMRASGADGGHHGLESVSRSLGTPGHPRLRLGIGRGNNLREISGFVLERFDTSEMELKEAVEKRAVKQVLCWISDGTEKAIQKFNGSIQMDPPKKQQATDKTSQSETL